MINSLNTTKAFLGNLNLINCHGIRIKSSRNFYTYTNEPAQQLPNEPKWVSAEEAVKCVKSNDWIYVQGAAGTPNNILCALCNHGLNAGLKNVRICHMHTEGPALYTKKEYDGIFRSVSFFMGGNVRQCVAEGRGDSIPLFLSHIPMLFQQGHIKPNVAIVTVSPPDNHGFCSLGTSVDCARAGIQAAKIIIAQVNENMPRTFGDSIVHKSHIDFAVQCNVPLPVHPHKPLTDEEAAIGTHIAEKLVDDGATLQMGIGNIPDAVLAKLDKHKHLGIHSEMFANGVIALVKKGVVTNQKKSFHKGRIVTSFLVGDKTLYDFVHNNTGIEMLRCNYVNSTTVIGRNPRMTAINSAIEVDLTGQVVSDSIGQRMFSGFGGQVDFIRGAAQGLDNRGRPIIALPSITNKGESKIVPVPKLGAGVVTSRGHVHYVVTEYGVAYLFGKTLLERAYELIQIAHPEHRACLEKCCFDRFKAMPIKPRNTTLKPEPRPDPLDKPKKSKFEPSLDEPEVKK